MLLRRSGESTGDDLDISAVIGRGGHVEVRHAAQILELVTATINRSEQLAAPRDAARAALGDDGLVDACAVIAAFSMFTRIADGTGIPLDGQLALITERLREDLGINSYASSANTRANPIRSAVGRVLAPAVPTAFKVMSSAIKTWRSRSKR